MAFAGLFAAIMVFAGCKHHDRRAGARDGHDHGWRGDTEWRIT